MFLIGGDLRDVLDKPKKRFQGLFDCVVLSSTAAHNMKRAELNTLLKPNAVTLVETAKYMVPIQGKAKSNYMDSVNTMATALGWQACGDITARASSQGGDGSGAAQAGSESKDESKAPTAVAEEGPPLPDYLIYSRS